MSTQLEDVLAELRADGCDYAIASGGGRMQITMDRYEANWPMVEAGWRTHVQGLGRQFPSAKEAIETYRAETGCIDQDLPAFVVASATASPSATIANGDSVVLLQLPRRPRAGDLPARSTARTSTSSTAATTPASTLRRYAGIRRRPEDPDALPRPAARHQEHPDRASVRRTASREYAVSETQKYGHVTYFWNGNRSGKVDEELETYEEIPSDVIPFEQAPAMKSKEITDRMIAAMESGKYDFLRCNFPNGDMVGHTGVH